MTDDLTNEERELLVKVLDNLQYNGLEAARAFMVIQEKLRQSLLPPARADAPTVNGGT